MLSVLSTSAGTCTERHRCVCSYEPALDPQPILELPLAELAQQLRTEELSLESVLCSYLEQALKVHQEVNYLMDFLGECKEELQALKKLKTSERGLLYGVPMSLKDTYDCMDPRTSQHLEEIRGVGTPKKLREQHTAVEEYQQEFIAKWRSLDLDVLLVPVLGSAFYIGSSSLAQWVLVGLRLGVQDS
ncbi:PREDICTED: vitamin D3 hydroxylase-associated protein-like isoform X3 [Cercocebus atys]|uniref:vitamin D3 hydroxylase-associated protein-like isoform X3 n=1 Tax=Cercocebus atys TaxID=9531 RepID=UPI0005F3B237|nr:PREDICTED: vitamin D3 hydroxylase-associated protein-like isoform X3 [Cercocebus atys]